MKRRICFFAVGVAISAMMSASGMAADYSGNYDSAQLALTLTNNANSYSGEIHLGDQKFPVTAHEDADHLTGEFNSGGNAFPFTATGHGDDLTLISGGRTYQLHRRANTLVNPLAAAPVAATADPLADYALLNSSKIGRSLMREFPNAKTTRAALQGVFPDLAKSFGVRPTILGSYEDERDHKSAFVSFSVQIAGEAYKGFVTTKLRDQGAVAFVVYGKQSATKAEWAALTARPDVAVKTDSAPAKEDDLKTKMAAVPLTPYSFPDGTGAIGLAEGWTTKSQTESHLVVTGPADQTVRMAFGGVIYTPDSLLVRQGQANAVNAAVAPFADNSADLLSNIIRANSAVSQRHGGPKVDLDKIVKVTDIQSRNQGGHAAQIIYDNTITTQGVAKKYSVLIQFDASPPRNGTWGYYVSLQLIAPRETFQNDLPVMMAQAFSLSENAGAIMAKSQREIGEANRRAEAQRAQANAVAQANYAHTKSVEDASAAQSKHWADIDNDETKRLRTATDFDETLRGIRTVEDTQTGEKTSVDLGNVHDIVDKLNEQDPGRYKEIPLRDEVYPLPGHENDPDYLQR